jgi:hypothetical protein
LWAIGCSGVVVLVFDPRLNSLVTARVVIAGYHIISGTCGFWLPNDPRGSWSSFVGSWEQFQYGRATQTHERRSLAYKPHDRATRRAAKSAVQYPPVTLTGVQARAVTRGFACYVER